MTRLLLLSLCLFLAACGSSDRSPNKGTTTQQQLTIDDVKMMSKNGLPDNTIINRIRDAHSVFHLNPDQVIDLKNSGVSQGVIDYMVETGEEPAK